MSPEQALQVLHQVLVTKIGLTAQDIQLVLQAWQVLGELVKQTGKAEDKPDDG